MKKQEEGITLVALVITIIILLILAGITISLVLGDNGILNRTKTAGEEYTKASIKEEIELGIADIGAEFASKVPPEGISDKAIVDNLAIRMQETITIDDNLIGEYKGYAYWIDQNYVVHIGNKIKDNKTMSVKLQKTYIGTSSATVEVIASSTQGNIQSYVYAVNGVEKETKTENTYTIENLEPETEYRIQVTAIDEKGNKKTSNIIKIKTEARFYLYHNGVEDITISKEFIVFQQYEATCSIIKNDTNMGYNSNCNIPTNWHRGISKEINLENSNYTKLCINVVEINDSNISAGIGKIVPDSGGAYGNFTKSIELNQGNKTYEISINEIQEITNIMFRSSGTRVSNILFDAIWLEK